MAVHYYHALQTNSLFSLMDYRGEERLHKKRGEKQTHTKRNIDEAKKKLKTYRHFE